MGMAIPFALGIAICQIMFDTLQVLRFPVFVYHPLQMPYLPLKVTISNDIEEQPHRGRNITLTQLLKTLPIL
jgi:hypothetical protein